MKFRKTAESPGPKNLLAMHHVSDSNGGDSRIDRLINERQDQFMAVPVKYDNPPVVELVFSTQFATPQPIKSAHVGRYWETVLSSFPTMDDAAPLDPVIETKGDDSTINIEFNKLPTLRRTWLVSEDGRSLLQIQGDRFIFNWKRDSFEIPYPSYDNVIEDFEHRLGQFTDFLTSVEVGKPTFQQFELTYVNHITSENGLAEATEGGVLVDHERKASEGRFLPVPEAINWRTSYQLPRHWGRLHVAAVSAVNRRTGEKIVRLDLTARGLPNDPDGQRREWFDLGHEWITRGFADITPEKLHKIWKRKA